MPTDVISFGETMLRFSVPHGLRMEDATNFRVYVAGTESNTLACLARLRLKATWVSALPANPLGRHVEAELRRHGVDTSHVVWMGNARLGTLYSEEAPDPLGIQIYYDRANSACSLIDPTSVDLSVVDQARILHLTGITAALGQNARKVFAQFLQRAQEKHIPISFDVNYRAKLWNPHEAATGIEAACQQASLLFCTQADAAELWGLSGNPETVLRQIAERFAPHGEPKTIVLTLGSDGAAQLQDGVYSAEPAIPTTGTMRIGSGDAFAAGYLYAYLDGQLYRELHANSGITALTFGNALAALKRCIADDIAIVTLDEVRALLQRRATRFR
jgi:2-dehydro-3-deoxygluconokinase